MKKSNVSMIITFVLLVVFVFLVNPAMSFQNEPTGPFGPNSPVKWGASLEEFPESFKQNMIAASPAPYTSSTAKVERYDINLGGANGLSYVSLIFENGKIVAYVQYYAVYQRLLMDLQSLCAYHGMGTNFFTEDDLTTQQLGDKRVIMIWSGNITTVVMDSRGSLLSCKPEYVTKMGYGPEKIKEMGMKITQAENTQSS